MILTIARIYHPIDNQGHNAGFYGGVIDISTNNNLLLQLATSQCQGPTKKTPIWTNKSTYLNKTR